MKEELMDNAPMTPLEDKRLSRRLFLNYAGIAGAGLFIASCAKDGEDKTVTPADGSIDLGTRDAGLLNYLYALKQVTAAFYAKLCQSFYDDAIEFEQDMLIDIRDHEIANREWLRNINTTNALQDLQFNFSAIDFTSRSSVLDKARWFEDLTVAAYNGMAKLVITPGYLLTIAKMNSVDARHAAFIHELLSENSFASTTDQYGLDQQLSPANVISGINQYLVIKVSGANLPIN